MKLYHFTILFIIIALTLFVIVDVKTNSLVAVTKEKESLDKCFNRAIDDAVTNLVEIEGIEDIKINKQRAVSDFFQSMNVSLDIVDNPDKQELLKNYVPVIAVTCEDGYYLYYSDEYKGSDNYTYINKRWSEKHSLYYEDKDFIYCFTFGDLLTIYDKTGLLDTTKEQKIFTLDYHELANDDEYAYFRAQRPDSFLLDDESYYHIRKGCIIDSIEKSMSYYCNKHNSIAQQYGITYNFVMPVIDNSEWTRSIDNPSIIVLFQGYPYSSSVLDTYNRFGISGSHIKKNTVYYLEQKDWYYVYHRADCPEIKKGGIMLLDEPYESVSDCVSKGAYACPTCSYGTGVYPPKYIP